MKKSTLTSACAVILSIVAHAHTANGTTAHHRIADQGSACLFQQSLVASASEVQCRCSQCEKNNEKQERMVQAAVQGAVNIANAVTSVALAKQNGETAAQQQATVAATVSTIMGSIANLIIASTRTMAEETEDTRVALQYVLSVPTLRHQLEEALTAHIIAQLNAAGE